MCQAEPNPGRPGPRAGGIWFWDFKGDASACASGFEAWAVLPVDAKTHHQNLRQGLSYSGDAGEGRIERRGDLGEQCRWCDREPNPRGVSDTAVRVAVGKLSGGRPGDYRSFASRAGRGAGTVAGSTVATPNEWEKTGRGSDSRGSAN